MLLPLCVLLSVHETVVPEWRRPFAELPPPKSVAEIAHVPLGASHKGTTLTFLARSKFSFVRYLGGLGFLPMHQVGDSDLWILRFRMSDWSRAFVSYAFLDSDDSTLAAGVWRGSKAPTYTRAARLTGRLVDRTLTNDALGEARSLHIYLPPRRATEVRKPLPAFFLTDGQDCEEFARALEPLILARKVASCAIVGVESPNYREDPERRGEYDESRDDRARDYLWPVDPPRFEQHLRFFVDEVGAYVASEFGISRHREDRAVVGFSNGGAFCVSVARRRPEAFAVSIPMSPAIQDAEFVSTPPAPRMMFVGGELEPLGASARAESDYLRRRGVTTTYTSYPAGHDSAMWHLAFSRLAPGIFPVKP